MDNKLIIDHKYVEKGIGYEWNIIPWGSIKFLVIRKNK